jgi:hypothetical protein
MTTLISNDCLAVAGKSQQILIVFYPLPLQQVGLFLRNNTPYRPITSRGPRDHDERLVAEQGVPVLMSSAQLQSAFHFGFRPGSCDFPQRLCPKPKSLILQKKLIVRRLDLFDSPWRWRRLWPSVARLCWRLDVDQVLSGAPHKSSVNDAQGVRVTCVDENGPYNIVRPGCGKDPHQFSAL